MIARLVALLVLAIALYFGISGSWTTAILFFVFYGGLEFTLYSFDSAPAEEEERKT